MMNSKASRRPYTVVTSLLVDGDLQAFAHLVYAQNPEAAAAIGACLADETLGDYDETTSLATVFDGHVAALTLNFPNDDLCHACFGTGLQTEASTQEGPPIQPDEKALTSLGHPDCSKCDGTGRVSPRTRANRK